MNRLTAIATLVLILPLTPLLLADEESEVVPQTLQELQDAVANVVEENNLPAVGIAMVDETGPVWVDALGMANLEDSIDADADSMFRIGSTSKMFVALSVLKLVEEGRLSLDDRVADLAPDIAYENQWEETDPVRIVHLLEHTTGWDDIHLPEYASNDPTPLTLKEGLDFHPHSRISRWKPGSRMSYCNAGPPVAAYIVEKVTGQEFERYVHENFFDPMGMETMTYRLSADVEKHGVTSYMNGNQPQNYWHIVMRPSGSINASPQDMAKMVALFLNRGTVDGLPLIMPGSLDRMERTESTTAAEAGQEIGYGLNNYVSIHESWAYREHNGGVNGGITELAYLPEAGVGHAIMVNSDDGASFWKISELIRDFETRNLEAVIVESGASPGVESSSIEGLYYPINPRQQISHFIDRIFGIEKLWFDGDKLQRKPLLGGDATTYLAGPPNLYRDDKTGLVSLAEVVDPLAGRVVHAGSRVLKPVSPLLAYGQLGVVIAWVVAIATSFLYFLVWGVRRLRGKIPAGSTVRIRLWPLLAGLSFAALIGLFTLGMSDPFMQLGTPSPVAVGIMLSSILFAVFAALGVYTSIRERGSAMNRANYWHSSITSFVHAIVACYLLWFGVIGLMTWG
ncbi:MAG: serine hydrolase domain-containing protein [Woeseiaceae bacterium]